MIGITYVGHATVLIEAAGVRLLTDPVLRPHVMHLRRIVPPPVVDEIREPDAVLLSHAHFDHLDVPSLRLLSRARVIAPRGCGRLLRRGGAADVIELAPEQRLTIGSVVVTAVSARHDGRRHPFSRARETLAYIVEGTGRCFFAGDTDLFDGMADLGDDLDVALLPIWGWGSRVGAGHMDPSRAARAVELLQPHVAIPIHWGTLASPHAPWRNDPERPAREFAALVARHAPRVEVRVLAPGVRCRVADSSSRRSRRS